jgi:signal transduction histidine kinase
LRLLSLFENRARISVDSGPAILLGIAIGLAAAVPLALLLTKRTERRARASERRARQAEHLAYVGTLTAGIAHEIRNPLSTLNLNLQLLREDLDRPGNPADARLVRKLDALEQEAKRLQQILDDFLRYAGKQEVRLAVQPINPILEECVSFYRDRLQRAGVQVRTSFAEGLPPVALDPARLKQAVSNLLLNAESAMPAGGDLMIATEPERRGLRLHVTDTGHGIAREDLDKIFAPYYSTRQGGTGLGLPTVRRIVQEHSATLEVHSEVGRGTRFTIHFPAPDANATAEPRT